MLQAINDRIKGWLGGFVVALIALPFAFWGIQSYLGGGEGNVAAKVNDAEIGVRELEWSVSRQRQRLAQRYDGEIPIEDRVLRQQVLEQLINTRVLNQATFESGYRIADDTLMETVRRTFDREGGFDRAMFEAVLQSQGMTEQMFMEQMRQDLRVKQLQQAIAGTAVVIGSEVKRIAQLEHQTRDFTLVNFDIGHFASKVEPSDEEIRAAYEASPERFMTPERVSVDYVELKGEMLADELTVNEDRINLRYQEYLANLTRQQSRKARHILLKVDNNNETVIEKLEGIRKRILAGESFAQLAEQYSEDPVSAEEGGDLGWIEGGQMVKPFEQALFELEKGEVSPVVETQFGLHLIKLEDIKSEEPKPLAEMKDKFIKELTKDEAASIFYDLSEAMAVAAYENPDSLGAVVDSLNVETRIRTSDLFDRNRGNGLAQHEKIRRAAFSPAVLNDGMNSDIIELSPDHIVVLRLNKRVPATLKPLEQVRDQIVASLKRSKGRELALQSAQDTRAKLEHGQAVKSMSGKGASVEQKKAISRNDRSVSPAVINQVFGMNLSDTDKPEYELVDSMTGNISLVHLDAVNIPEQIEQDKLAKIKQQLTQSIAYQELQAVIDAFVDKADIYRNPKVLE